MEEVTLLFRHLPAELTLEEREDLLYYLGASRVKVMSKTGPLATNLHSLNHPCKSPHPEIWNPIGEAIGSVKMNHYKMKNTAFAAFANREQATQVLKQLHQVEFLGSRLVVEFAKTQLASITGSVLHKGSSKELETGDEEMTVTKKEGEHQNHLESREIKFDTTFGIWGLKYPRRPELRYAYPPPTPSILTNILNALVAVPKFYVQVLHLMNKMDLPAPFGLVTPTPPMNPDVREPTQPDNVDTLEMDISSETESELESGEENDKEKRSKREYPNKRLPKRHLKKHAIKKPRLSDLQDSGIPVASFAAALQVSQVFEQAAEATAGTKRIELKLPSSLMPVGKPELDVRHRQHFSLSSVPSHMPQTHFVPDLAYSRSTIISEDYMQQHQQQQQSVSEAETQQAATALLVTLQKQHLPPVPPVIQEQHLSASYSTNVEATENNQDSHEKHLEVDSVNSGGFGIIKPVPKEQKMENEEENLEKEWSKSDFITSSELRRLQLSSSERKKMSVFKNYDEGEPSCRLYLKNLAKNVTEEDIHWVYGRYVDWDSDLETNIFDIKLMKEGRMKGQAFVTLPNEKSAKKAVRDTNGLLLKDKPMVVQFARSAKVKNDEPTKSSK